MATELGNRPLLATARDQKLSIRRPEVDILVGLARRGLNVLLVGDRGAGKTSALHAVEYALRKTDLDAVLVDAARATEVGELARLIDRAVDPPRDREAARSPVEQVLLDALGVGPAAVRSEAGGALQLVRAWRALEHGTCVLLDEVAPELAHAFFGRLRDELWQTPVRFVVAAPSQDLATFLAPPADVFFEAKVTLEPFSPPDQEALLRRRVDGPEGDRVVSALRGADLGNPRQLISMARDALVAETGEGEVEAAARERARRVAGLGPAAERLLLELEAVGPASASDPRLLERLGWSRQRAAQVARTLEAAGLVTSGTTRGEDGRARRVFSPVGALSLADEPPPARR
jgi:hypothetical protein